MQQKNPKVHHCHISQEILDKVDNLLQNKVVLKI